MTRLVAVDKHHTYPLIAIEFDDLVKLKPAKLTGMPMYWTKASFGIVIWPIPPAGTSIRFEDDGR